MRGDAMWRNDIEIILARQLSDYLAMPIFLVDPEGNLAFYNEPAEMILGRRFQETGRMSAEEWTTAFQPSDKRGNPLPPGELPLMIALTQRRPHYGEIWIRGLDGVVRHIAITGVPLVGQQDRFVGAMAIFWEMPE